MTARRASAPLPLALAIALAFASATAVTFALDDVAGIACLSPGIARGVLGAGVAAFSSGIVTLVAARSARGALAAATTASASVALLVRVPSPWLDLGPFGAGPFTALTAIVLPIAVVAGTLAGYAITRGASRTPPSSRPPSRRR